MSQITDFLPQYRGLNSLFTNIVDSGAVSYAQQQIITEFYRQFADVKVFEKMVLDIVLENEKSIGALLLLGIKTEVDNHIRIYESSKELFNGIDTQAVCQTEASRFTNAIKAQLEAVTEYGNELNQINGSLDAMGFREHTEQEESRLWQKHEHLTKLYSEEKEKLTALYDQQESIKREVAQYCENVFEKIYPLSRSFLTVLNCYLPSEEASIEPPIEEIAEEMPASIIDIEPDTIFRAKMFEKLQALERKLIDSKYLSPDLHWVSTHENGKSDIKRLVIFLTGLAENNYFLPNRDPKIKAFFENRYHISIGQNFEKSRRKQYIGEYKMVFYDYPF